MIEKLLRRKSEIKENRLAKRMPSKAIFGGSLSRGVEGKEITQKGMETFW